MTKSVSCVVGERVSCREDLVAGDRGGELEECEEVVAVAFVADVQSAVAGEPGDGAFDFPAASAESCRIIDAAAGDARHDLSRAQPLAVGVGVVALVGAELVRFAAARAASGSHGGDGFDHFPQLGAVVGVGCGNIHDQRGSAGFGEHVKLGAGFASVDGAWAGQRAPLFARTLAASKIADDQSSSPAAPSLSTTARWILPKTPALAHWVNRRCAVGTVTPNSAGRCRQAQPLVSTYTIAVNTDRLSSGAVPPPWGRGSNSGTRGSAISQNASGTNRRDNSFTT
jgi:hypothetical protein